MQAHQCLAGLPSRGHGPRPARGLLFPVSALAKCDASGNSFGNERRPGTHGPNVVEGVEGSLDLYWSETWQPPDSLRIARAAWMLVKEPGSNHPGRHRHRGTVSTATVFAGNVAGAEV